jgi:hypothetical protein
MASKYPYRYKHVDGVTKITCENAAHVTERL